MKMITTTYNANRFLSRQPIVLASILALAIVAPAGAVSVGQTDDFQDGTTQAWEISAGGFGSSPPAILPAVVDDQGPAGPGDAALLLSTNGRGFGAGHKLVVLNLTQWAGDYLSAGVSGLRFVAANPNAADLSIRVGVNGSGGGFVTDAALLPAGSGYTSLDFDLSPGALISVGGGFDAMATLSTVNELRILHNPDTTAAINGSADGAPIISGSEVIAGSLLIDNVTATPEPGAGLLALIATSAAFSATRRRKAFRSRYSSS